MRRNGNFYVKEDFIFDTMWYNDCLQGLWSIASLTVILQARCLIKMEGFIL